MLRQIVSVALIAGAAAFAPGAVLPTVSHRNVAAVGPTMQRIGSARPTGGQVDSFVASSRYVREQVSCMTHDTIMHSPDLLPCRHRIG